LSRGHPLFTVSNNRLSNARCTAYSSRLQRTGTIAANVASKYRYRVLYGPSFNYATGHIPAPSTTSTVSTTITMATSHPVQNTWPMIGQRVLFPAAGCTTTTPPPVITTTATVPISRRCRVPREAESQLVSTTVSCTAATCVGALELTKRSLPRSESGIPRVPHQRRPSRTWADALHAPRRTLQKFDGPRTPRG